MIKLSSLFTIFKYLFTLYLHSWYPKLLANNQTLRRSPITTSSRYVFNNRQLRGAKSIAGGVSSGPCSHTFDIHCDDSAVFNEGFLEDNRFSIGCEAKKIDCQEMLHYSISTTNRYFKVYALLVQQKNAGNKEIYVSIINKQTALFDKVDSHS